MNATIRAATALAFLAVSVTAAAAFGTGEGTAGTGDAAGDVTAVQDRPEGEEGPRGDRCGRPGRGPRHRRMHRLLVTGESKIQVEGGFATVNVDVGEVTGVDGNAVTIKRADGESVTATASDETKVCKDGRRAEVGAIEEGDLARIMRLTRDGETRAKRIHVRSPGEDGAEPAGPAVFEPPELAA